MKRGFDFTGGSLGRFLAAFQLIARLLALLFVALPFDGVASVALAVVFAALAVATAVGQWRSTTESDGRAHRDTADDITYDPVADPGQAAKDRWERALRRLPGRDDEGAERSTAVCLARTSDRMADVGVDHPVKRPGSRPGLRSRRYTVCRCSARSSSSV